MAGNCCTVIILERRSSSHDQATPPTAESQTQSPPPFSSLYFPPVSSADCAQTKVRGVTSGPLEALPAFAPLPPPADESSSAAAVAETKAALPRDTKDGPSSGKDLDDGEPPPPYSEGSSPIESFTYVMATAGGPASIITQVQQGGGPALASLGGRRGDIIGQLGHGS